MKEDDSSAAAGQFPSAGPPASAGAAASTQSFERDPAAFLSFVAALPCSRESLKMLGGNVASAVSAWSLAFHAAGGSRSSSGLSIDPSKASEVAYLYLQAAARHLPSEQSAQSSIHAPPTRSTRAATTTSSVLSMVNPYSFQFNPAGASAVATAAMSATATAAEGMVLSGGDGDGNDQEAGYEEETNNFTDEDGELPAATAADGTSATAPTLAGGGGSDSVTAAGAPASSSSADRSTAYSIRAILEAVGNSAVCCRPRSLISQSGILPALARMLPQPPETTNGNHRPNVSLVALTKVHVEFLQTCIYAKQYRYGEGLVSGLWARPTGGGSSSPNAVSVEDVLRYYYVRGCLHIGTNNWAMARRCLWTCLSVPAENLVSAIAIAAWKKLVLVQCRTLLLENPSLAQNSPTRVPKAAPACFSKFLNNATAPSDPTGATGGAVSTTSSQISLDAALGTASRMGGVAQTGHDDDNDLEAMHLIDASSDNEGPSPYGPSNSSGSSRSPPPQPAAPEDRVAAGVKAYTDLAGSYADLDQPRFLSLMAEHEGLLRRDGNLGLIQQCRDQLLRRRVIFWSKVYSAISLQDLASAVAVTAEQLNAIVWGLSVELVWPIQVRDGIVHFPPVPILNPTGDSSPSAASMEELVQLARLAQDLDAGLAASSKYQSAASKKSGRSSTGVGSGGSIMGRRGSERSSLELGPLGVEEIF